MNKLANPQKTIIPIYKHMTSGTKLLALASIIESIKSSHNFSELTSLEFLHIINKLGCDILEIDKTL